MKLYFSMLLLSTSFLVHAMQMPEFSLPLETCVQFPDGLQVQLQQETDKQRLLMKYIKGEKQTMAFLPFAKIINDGDEPLRAPRIWGLVHTLSGITGVVTDQSHKEVERIILVKHIPSSVPGADFFKGLISPFFPGKILDIQPRFEKVDELRFLVLLERGNKPIKVVWKVADE